MSMCTSRSSIDSSSTSSGQSSTSDIGNSCLCRSNTMSMCTCRTGSGDTSNNSHSSKSQNSISNTSRRCCRTSRRSNAMSMTTCRTGSGDTSNNRSRTSSYIYSMTMGSDSDTMSMCTSRTGGIVNASNRCNSSSSYIYSMTMSSDSDTMSMCTCRSRSNGSSSCSTSISCNTSTCRTGSRRCTCSICNSNCGSDCTSITSIRCSTSTCRTGSCCTSSSCSTRQGNILLLSIVAQVSLSSTNLFPDKTSGDIFTSALINSDELNIRARHSTVASYHVDLTHGTSSSCSSRCSNATICGCFLTSSVSNQLNTRIDQSSNIRPSFTISRAILDILRVDIIRYTFNFNLFNISHYKYPPIDII